MTGRDAAPTRDTSLETSHAVTWGRIRTWLRGRRASSRLRSESAGGRDEGVAGASGSGELVRLPLPCPPQLIELSGYTGGARLVALWWSPVGEELMTPTAR